MSNPAELAAQLLSLMKNKDKVAAIKAVLDSGVLPDDVLREWSDKLIERAIHRAQGYSNSTGYGYHSTPAWEQWVANWLSGADRSEAAAKKAKKAAKWEAAAWATWVASLPAATAVAKSIEYAVAGGMNGELTTLYNTLFELITRYPPAEKNPLRQICRSP